MRTRETAPAAPKPEADDLPVGPLTVGQVVAFNPRPLSDPTYVLTTTEGPLRTVAVIYGSPEPEIAHLLAASPNMLRALRRSLESLSTGPATKARREVIAEVKAAIAQATNAKL